MRQYEQLQEDQRLCRRTLADALEVLRDHAGFDDHHRAEVSVGLLQLPSGHVVGQVVVLFDAASDDRIYTVSLPSAAHFRAIRDGCSHRDRLDVERLAGALIDGDGHVTLADGTGLRAVEVMPVHMPNRPSELEWRIVHHTISILGAEEQCYRRLRDDVPPALRHMTPDLRFLDCSRLQDLNLRPLKLIASLIAEKEPHLRKLSTQKVADALRTFGIRVPKPRPRKAG